MGIYIPREYICRHTKWSEGTKIETIFDLEPRCPSDIIGFNGEKIKTSLLTGEPTWIEMQNDFYSAYLDMKKTEERDKLLNYDVVIDVDFAKKFLYEKYIDKYGIIDNIIEVKVNKDNINVKYKIQDNIDKYIFKEGFELLKKYRLAN